MYISKRGPLLVLVATLLVMLSPLRCATMPSVRGEQRQAFGNPSRTYAYLLPVGEVPRRDNCSQPDRARRWTSDSFVSVYRNDNVHARTKMSQQRREKNGWLRLQTDVSRPNSQGEGKLFINIYNERAKRYICFERRTGKVKTRRQLPPSSLRRLVCRFEEQHVSGSYMYVAAPAPPPRQRRGRCRDKRRVITFCHDRVAKLAKLRPLRRVQRAARAVRCRQAGSPRNSARCSKRRKQRRELRCQNIFMKDSGRGLTD